MRVLKNPLSTLLLVLLFLFPFVPSLTAAGGHHLQESAIPYSLDDYKIHENEAGKETLLDVLKSRAQQHPFNVVATLIFFCAILHTFLATKINHCAHRLQVAHEHRMRSGGNGLAENKPYRDAKDDVSFWAEVLHFLGEVEAIFGIWCIPLVFSVIYFHDWSTFVSFIDQKVNYTEPMFVVVIMTMASTRPVLKFAEAALRKVARIGKNSPGAWWCSILIIAPILGSFITEPAAMTIAALLLAKQFYQYQPSRKFKYATLGLLFVNVSVGGTFTHFAAPPVLMVAGRWGWDMAFMFEHFGWKALIGITISTAIYYFVFRKELSSMAVQVKDDPSYGNGNNSQPIPVWVTIMVLCFMAWTVLNLHNPPLFIAGFLFFIAMTKATSTHHDAISIKNPLLVGFFLAGLVTHGALQQWWIEPVLGRLGELPLFGGATLLTAFNDNAAITFLASQVPEFDPAMLDTAAEIARAHALQYAVVAGAVTGGGLTVIANAPNPAGQNILQRFFKGGIAPIYLTLGALVPTAIMAACFLLL
ncbi:MAG: putative Na+/H+ antiporter [Opitutales bacterium]|nr:putative Na+/H+ antiporter [Opitutales bacterium]